MEIDHKIFPSHSLSSADSRRAVVSFFQKNVHNTGKLLIRLSLPRKVWLGKLTTLNMTCLVDGPLNLNTNRFFPTIFPGI